MTRLCTLSPSRPASGLSLIENVTEIVGGSMGCAGIGTSTAGSHSVSADIPCLCLLDRLLTQAPEGEDLGHAKLFDLAPVTAECAQHLARGERPALNPARQHPPQIGVRRQRGRQHREGLIDLRRLPRRGHMRCYQTEQR